MKIVDAVWEKRNLGLDCTEFTFIKSDNADEVKERVSSIKTKYQIAKVPSTRPDLLLLLQDYGFKCIEMNIRIKHNNVQKFVIPIIFDDLLRDKEVEIIQPDRHQWFMKKIASSNMFNSDKVAVDPFFSVEASSKRYALWSQDYLNAGGLLFGIKNEEQWIGFGIGKENSNNKQYEGFLGGVFPEYAGTGYGILPVIAALRIAKKLDCKTFISGVSSNNISILQFDMMLGFEITKFTYNLVKHVD